MRATHSRGCTRPKKIEPRLQTVKGTVTIFTKYLTCIALGWQNCDIDQVVHKSFGKALLEPMKHPIHIKPVNFHWATLRQIGKSWVKRSTTNGRGKAVTGNTTINTRVMQNEHPTTTSTDLWVITLNPVMPWSTTGKNHANIIVASSTAATYHNPEAPRRSWTIKF